MRSREDLISRVAKKLGVLAAGQSLSAEDSQSIDEEIDGIISELAFRRVVYIANPGSIEDAFLDPVALIVASRVADEFGAVIDPREVFAAEQRLRMMQIRSPTGEPVRPDYF